MWAGHDDDDDNDSSDGLRVTPHVLITLVDQQLSRMIHDMMAFVLMQRERERERERREKLVWHIIHHKCHAGLESAAAADVCGDVGSYISHEATSKPIIT